MVRPSKQRPNLLVLLSVSCSYKLIVYIITNQFVHCGVISVENVSLEDLVGSNFPLWIGMSPPLPYLLDIKLWGRGGEAAKADWGVGGGRDSTTTKLPPHTDWLGGDRIHTQTQTQTQTTLPLWYFPGMGWYHLVPLKSLGTKTLATPQNKYSRMCFNMFCTELFQHVLIESQDPKITRHTPMHQLMEPH